MFGNKPRGATKRPVAAPKRQGPLVPSWLWTIFGIIFGLSCLVFLYLWQPWEPTPHGTPSTASTASTTDDNATDEKKPADFQFYDLLPKQQVTPVPTQTVPDVVPDDATVPVVESNGVDSSNNGTDTTEAPKPKSSQHYMLQVNSFQSADEADKQRASVLLAGLPADVRHTTSDGQEWYRVVSGPFNSKNEALRAQRQLQDSGIDALVVAQSE